jgi:hypothetical protein
MLVIPDNLNNIESVKTWLLKNIHNLIAYRIDTNYCTCCAYESIEVAISDKTKLGVSIYKYFGKRKHLNMPFCGDRCNCMEFIWANQKAELMKFDNDDLLLEHLRLLDFIEFNYLDLLDAFREKNEANKIIDQINDEIAKHIEEEDANSFSEEKNFDYYFKLS